MDRAKLMNHFAWTYILFLLPLPLIARAILSPAPKGRRESALKVPFFTRVTRMKTGPSINTSRFHNSLLAILSYFAWIFLVVAAARPQWIGEPIKIDTSGRDLMMAIDLSKSMSIDDFVLSNMYVNRLDAVKNVATKFIQNREGDRIGLVLFGERAYLQSPLTYDRQSIMQMVDEAEIGLAGGRTAIGDAMGIVLKYLKKQEVKEKVLILLTDGASNSGAITPEQALDIAKKENVKIYTIGVGAEEMQVRGVFGGVNTVNPSKDLDEDTLIMIAEATGGRYFRAKNTEELREIYAEIDELEPTEGDEVFFRPKKELFYIPFAISLLLAMIVFVLSSSGAFSNTYSFYKASVQNYAKSLASKRRKAS